MAHRCPRSPAPPPAPPAPPPAPLPSSVASLAETPSASPSSAGASSSASTEGGAARSRSGLARPNQSSDLRRAGGGGGGGVVCGLIGKFECTQPSESGADVKVTVNGGHRGGDSARLIAGTSPAAPADPGIGGDVLCRGRADKTPAMGGSARRSVAGSSAGGAGAGRVGGVVTVSNERKELPRVPRVARFGGQRQRKTVVYSRLCLDGAMLEALCPPGEEAAAAGSADRQPGPPEVIRFPCVERLIALYASIIREKEAEMQRFMSSIVRDGDKRRLDKGVSSSPSPSPLSPRSEKQVGDIRTATAQPAAPVTLGTPPNTVRPLEGTTREPPSVTLPADEVLRGAGARSKESPSPASDEGWRSTQPSPYGSSDEEERPRSHGPSDACGGEEEEEEHPESMKHRDKVTRSASSDSALGLDEELSPQEQQQMMATVGKVRRLTLGVSDIPLRAALLPVPEPTLLPTTTDSLATLNGGSGTADHPCPTVVRSKMILEAQLIELPVLPVSDSGPSTDQQQQQQQLGCPPSSSASRRESAQSYISDTGEGVRYVRTPSVVVSDYSDDTICGITLEEIEYFRRHRLRRRSADCESDLSAASSCSNLNYCGSSISALEGCEYQSGLRTPERKVSDCSTCSTVSCDEDEGYSVVRAKLANLCPPTTTTTAAVSGSGTTVPSVVSAALEAPAREPDVRICSKQSKVSPAPESCSSVQRPT